MVAIFESLHGFARFVFFSSRKESRRLFIIEPFFTYHHHRNQVRFYPTSLPKFTEKYLVNQQATLISANQLPSRDIYLLAADQAVQNVETVFPIFKKQHQGLMDAVCSFFSSNDGELIFKKFLCEQLADFYSANLMMSRLQALFPEDRIVLFPEFNPIIYEFVKNLIRSAGLPCEDDSRVQFSKTAIFFLKIKDSFVKFSISLTKLILPALAKLAALFFTEKTTQILLQEKIARFDYASTIVAPKRQLMPGKNDRDPGFFADGILIDRKSVVHIACVQLSKQEKVLLNANFQNSAELPSKWKSLMRVLNFKKIKAIFNCDGGFSKALFDMSLRAMVEYAGWKLLLSGVQFKKFISHSDCGFLHIPRNILLKQSGVETWYFLDGMNTLASFRNQSREEQGRHPFWAYLYYDHLVVWNEFIGNYYKSHPGAPRNCHVVGCLWTTGQTERADGNEFVIAAFESTYTRNGFTSYEEGILFVKHLKRLAEDLPQVKIVLKEKRYRVGHYSLDPVLCPQLLDFYDHLSRQSNIQICSNLTQIAELISEADLVISFPFSSPTIESISAGKAALWHDPMNFYRETPYGRLDCVTTHDYESLKERVEVEIQRKKLRIQEKDFPEKSFMFDPFCDGKALERFRNLLAVSKTRGIYAGN